MSDHLPTREDFEAVRHYAGEPCRCPQVARLIADEVPNVLCLPCKARKVMSDLLELSEGMS